MKRLFVLLALILAACAPAVPATEVAQQSGGVQTSEFSAALEGRSEARLRIRAPYENVSFTVLEDSDQLVEAEVQHVGEMRFGEEDGLLQLSESSPETAYSGDAPLQWTVGLSPNLPLNLELMIDSGGLTLDVAGLNLARLALTVGAGGSMDISLPNMNAAMALEVRVESGSIGLNMREGGTLNVARIDIGSGTLDWLIDAPMTINAPLIDIASGRLRIDAPDGAALRLEVLDVVSGSINLAYPLLRISGRGSDEGLWETDGFVNAEQQISLVVQHIASGSFELE